MNKKRLSTKGKETGCPKILYTDKGVEHEMYGHGCRTTEQAEAYIAMFPGTSFRLIYDDASDLKAAPGNRVNREDIFGTVKLKRSTVETVLRLYKEAKK